MGHLYSVFRLMYKFHGLAYTVYDVARLQVLIVRRVYTVIDCRRPSFRLLLLVSGMNCDASSRLHRPSCEFSAVV